MEQKVDKLGKRLKELAIEGFVGIGHDIDGDYLVAYLRARRPANLDLVPTEFEGTRVKIVLGQKIRPL